MKLTKELYARYCKLSADYREFLTGSYRILSFEELSKRADADGRIVIGLSVMNV